MALVPTGTLVDDARRRGHGIAAFNVITLEHAEAIVAGAESVAGPIILQVSQNAVQYHGGNPLPIARATAAVAESSTVPVALHLDHVESRELLYRAAEAGFSSVMYDAAALNHEDNICATRQAAEWAHRQGLWIEAELGQVGGKDGAHTPGVRTDPGAARDYVTRTGVDALAVAVGSSHAMTTRSARLDLRLIRELRDALQVPLVLHGSSGVSAPDLAAAVADGMVKINIGTMLNIAFTDAVRIELDRSPELVDPRRYLTWARERIADVVAELLPVLTVPLTS
ncbi:MAG: class II fructose-bisphosphate aldolase [Streptosporangiaceae bacterium]